jgi:hypothetical protein
VRNLLFLRTIVQINFGIFYMILKNYSIEREDNYRRWYRLRIESDLGEKIYSMETSTPIKIFGGKIVSINGNGCARKDFERAFKLFAYRDFDRGREDEVREALLELVCQNR